MAEYICGNEQEFVNQMNERAKGLGMENTHFVNCNGLDAEGHVTNLEKVITYVPNNFTYEDLGALIQDAEAQMNAELEKGYADMQAGHTRSAKSVFADIRKDYNL